MKIGIDLGGSHIGIGVVNENGEIIEKNETDLNNKNIEDMEKFILTYIIEKITKYNSKYFIEAIGIASPGTPKQEKITNIVNLGIKELDITNIIKKYFDIPVKIKNDAKCAAIAEKHFGSLKDYEDCVFICLGSGIGGAVFINEQELTPKRNPGIELGHMIIQKDGNLCNCGKKGCFETYCSMKRLKNNIIKTMNLPQDISGKELVEVLMMKEKEEQVLVLINEYIENLIIGLSNITDIFEPQAICLGGGFVYYQEILYKILVEKYYSKKYVFNKESMPELKLATLGNDAGIIGATCI